MRLTSLLTATAALLLATPAIAQTPAAPYTNGDQYVTLPSPERYSSAGKVEVVEVFSYGCIHCAHFVPYMEKLRKELPKDVSVHLIPADFSPVWEPFARAFYAAQQLGVVKATHADAFKAKFQYNYPMNSLSDYANFYARHGVSKAAFLKAANSAKTDKELAANNRLVMRWRIMGTPTIVVNGKYRSNHIKSYAQLVAMTQWLVARELKAQAGKH